MFNLAHAQIVLVLIVLLSLLCTLYMAYSYTILLEYTNLQLGCIDCYCYVHACE